MEYSIQLGEAEFNGTNKGVKSCMARFSPILFEFFSEQIFVDKCFKTKKHTETWAFAMGNNTQYM